MVSEKKLKIDFKQTSSFLNNEFIGSLLLNDLRLQPMLQYRCKHFITEI